MGNTLGKSVDHYNAAMRSLDTRVLVTARKFIDLAPLSSKELPTLKPIEQNPNTSSLPKLEEDS